MSVLEPEIVDDADDGGDLDLDAIWEAIVRIAEHVGVDVSDLVEEE